MSGTDRETPSLEQVLQNAIERRLCDMHTALPAEIISYDGKRAKVKTNLKRVLADDTEIEFPVLVNVPVATQAAGLAEIHLPLKEGDTGLVVFSERSLDIWKVSGGTVNPDDPRKFNLSDGVFFPTLRPFNKDTAYDAERLVIKFDKALATLKADGKFQFTNGTEELLDLIKQLIEKVSEMNMKLALATVNTIFGPMQLNNFSDFSTLEGEVDTIGTKLDTLKE